MGDIVGGVTQSPITELGFRSRQNLRCVLGCSDRESDDPFHPWTFLGGVGSTLERWET